MKDSTAGKVLCCSSPIVAGFAHIAMFYIGWPFDYRIIGMIAVGLGITGIVVSTKANKRDPLQPVSELYYLIAGIGILVGFFYASMFGPLIVFFPKI